MAVVPSSRTVMSPSRRSVLTPFPEKTEHLVAGYSNATFPSMTSLKPPGMSTSERSMNVNAAEKPDSLGRTPRSLVPANDSTEAWNGSSEEPE